DIRRQCKDYRRLRRRAIWSLGQIQSGVQLDFVAHGNLDAPAQVIVSGRSSGGWRRSWRLREDVRCKECTKHCHPKQSFHVAVLKMKRTSETRGSFFLEKSDPRTHRIHGLRELNFARR